MFIGSEYLIIFLVPEYLSKAVSQPLTRVYLIPTAHYICVYVQYSNKNISMRGQKLLKEPCTHIFKFDNYKRIKINNKIHVRLTARISYLFRYCKHMQ